MPKKEKMRWLPVLGVAAVLMCLAALSHALGGRQLVGEDIQNPVAEPVSMFDMADYSGSWRYSPCVTDAELEAELTEAGLTRELIARLLPRTGDTIELALEGDSVAVAATREPTFRAAPLEEWIEIDGGARARHVLERDALTQQLQMGDVEILRRYVIIDGKLTVGSIVTAQALSHPVTYSVDFERAEPPA